MKFSLKHTVYLLILFAISCGPKKGIVTKKSQESKKTETVTIQKGEKEKANSTKSEKPPTSIEIYIARYAPIAMVEMRKSQIPASITLAQGILESAAGRGRLAVEANNHFGIKCHGWKGAKIYHDDDRSQECFRKYQKAETSYEDHSDFLTGRRRYAKLFELRPDDYKGWARGLRAAGYATDRKYPQKLINLIERYELYKYDEYLLNRKQPEVVKINSGVVRYTVLSGDTLYSLSKRYNTTVEVLKELNNLTSTSISVGQELMIPN